MNFDEEFGDFDEDLDDSEPYSKTPTESVSSKTPALKAAPGGKKISIFLMSTIGPGEKRQKLLVDTGNYVGDIKRTAGSLFGLNPNDFHLSTGGITLDEGKALFDYNIDDGDEVLLIPASTAGI